MFLQSLGGACLHHLGANPSHPVLWLGMSAVQFFFEDLGNHFNVKNFGSYSYFVVYLSTFPFVAAQPPKNASGIPVLHQVQLL